MLKRELKSVARFITGMKQFCGLDSIRRDELRADAPGSKRTHAGINRWIVPDPENDVAGSC